MKPLVSVIVTCFNHENYIKECLESVFAQTHSNIELFVLNDGSTDKSGKIIEEIVQSSPYPQTTYIVQENMGVVLTRNKALNLINGDYFLFVDSDNYLEPNYLEEMLSVAQNEGANIVYPPIRNAETKDLILEAREFDLGKFYIENYIESCSLVERQKIGNLTYDSFLNYKKLEDYDFFLNLIVTRGLIAKPCHTTHLNYRVLPNSLNDHGNIRYHYEVYSYILGKYFAFYPQLAQKAMTTNYLKLFDLAKGEKNESQISIYYNDGHGFSELNKSLYPLDTQSILISITEGLKEIRVDLSENPSCYEKVALISHQTGKVLEVAYTNGFKYIDGYIFPKSDPQLIYNVENFVGEELALTYQSVSDKDVGEVLHALLSEKQEKQSELEKENARLSEVEKNYNLIISSKRWIISTKIINFFRRKK